MAKYPNFDEYLGELETICSNRDYDITYDFEGGYREFIYIESGTTSPSIVGRYNTDGEYFWFKPKMEFVKTIYPDDIDYSFNYFAKNVADACKIAQYLVDHQWKIEE